MVLGIALRDVLYQWAVVRQKVARYVDRLRVPNLAVFQTVLLRAQSRQEPQLRPDTKVGDDHVQGLIEQLVLADFGHEVVPDALLGRDRAGNAGLGHVLSLSGRLYRSAL